MTFDALQQKDVEDGTDNTKVPMRLKVRHVLQPCRVFNNTAKIADIVKKNIIKKKARNSPVDVCEWINVKEIHLEQNGLQYGVFPSLIVEQ
jgi:hypothetical protein